jgi:cytochrome d ubiquinol oxidase subunit II
MSTMDPSALQSTWFVLLGLVWGLYLVLGGTDLGVGMLVRRTDRSTALRAIGPTWAANDVWLIVAVAATLGAFPGWYAAWTSGLYVPLVVLVGAVMVRHGAIELIEHASPATQRRATGAIVAASAVTAFGWGVFWAAALTGDLADASGSGLGALTPVTVVAGLALVALCRVMGMAFLRLRVPASRNELSLLPGALVAVGLVLAAAAALLLDAAPGLDGSGPLVVVFAIVTALGLVALPPLARAGRSGRTLLAGAAVTGGGLATVLAVLFPTPIAGPGGVDLATAAAGDTTLTWMLVIALVLVPALLGALAFAYLRFLMAPEGGPRRGLAAAVARAARGTLGELR